MRFIRDIIDSQQRLADAQEIDDIEATDGPNGPLDQSSSSTNDADVLELSQDFALRPEQDQDASRGFDDVETPDESIDEDDEDVSAVEETGISAGQSDAHDAPSELPAPEIVPSRKTDGHMLQQIRKPEPVAPVVEEEQNDALDQDDDLPLPLRDRSENRVNISDAPKSRLRLHRSTASDEAPGEGQEVMSQLRETFVEEPEGEAETAEASAPAAPVRKSGNARARTRLLGFNPGAVGGDPVARLRRAEEPQDVRFPVGWLVVTAGPGRGASFTLSTGVAQIGRAENQAIRLDFGDTSISRENHAAIAYDTEQNTFFIGHGGKANLVRRNNRPVLSTEELSAGDTIRVGETTLRFVPFCGSDFSWDDAQQSGQTNAIHG